MVAVTGVIVVVNLAVLVVTMIPSQQDDHAPASMWLQPTIAFGAMALGMVWGLILRPLENTPDLEEWDPAEEPASRETSRTESTGTPLGVVGTMAVREKLAVPRLANCNVVQRVVGVALQIELEPVPNGFPGDNCGQTRLVTYKKAGIYPDLISSNK